MNYSSAQNSKWKTLLTALAVILLIASGISFWLIPSLSQYAPFVIIGCFGVLITVLMGFTKPALFTYITLFIILLPTDLIPADINSQLNRLATILAFFFWMINAFNKKKPFILTVCSGFMILFLMWSAFSLTWVNNFDEGFTTLQVYALRFILFLLVIPNVIRSENDLAEMMKVIVFSGILLIFVSIKTVLQGYTVGTRLQVLNVNENAIGMNLLLSVFAAIWLEQNSPHKHKNLYVFLTVAFLLASIAITGLSGSRGSAISWGISILILTIFKPTRRWGLFSLAIIAIAALFVPSIFTTTIERFLVVQGDTALGGREFLWPAALKLIKDHFFLGVGIGNSQFEMIPYLLISGARTVMRSGEPIHNPILVIWAETGIIGLLMYLGILGSVLVSFLKNWKNSIAIFGQTYNSYFPIMAAVAVGFLSSWIKGGGMESSFTFFLLISILLSSSVLVSNTSSMKKENE